MSAEHAVTFFITTARSGTQWTAAALENIYPGVFKISHEPIGYAYEPRNTLRDISKLRSLLEKKIVREHFDKIHEEVQSRPYIEVGFPAFALAPLLREEFGSRLRLVQLTRHPAQVAASLVTHRWFNGTRPDIQDSIMITPTDAGASLPDYKARWSSMTQFEKGLYFWYQVHSFGLEQEHSSGKDAFARFQFEDLISTKAIQEDFCAFLGVPRTDTWDEFTSVRVDKYRTKTLYKINVRTFRRNPEILNLSQQLGYDPLAHSN